MQVISRSERRPRLSAVVPCYNEEAVLDVLHARLSAACRDAAGDDYEIVLIDDGSADATRAMIRRMQAEDPHVVGVFLSRNHGHQLALSAGLSVAAGARIFVLDADLQDPPELLCAMMARMDDGFDVVYGVRRSRAGESAFKLATANMFYRVLNRIVDIHIPVDAGDFRLMSRRVVDVLQAMPERHRFIRGMVSWIGYPQTEFLYDRDPRLAGETKYPLRKMVGFAIDAITGFSTAPLRISAAAGFVCAGLSALLGLYVLIAWMAGATVEGWSSIALLVLFMGGVQLIMVGILGEYVGRLYMQSKARPMFVIEEVLREERAPDTQARHA